MSRIDALAEDLIGRCEPGPAGTCRIHHLDRDEDGHCPEWRRAVSEIDDLLEQVRTEAGANRSVIAAHDSERRRALRERDEARAEAEALARGRCLDTITDRGDEHWTSTCILASGHETAHDDGMGARWTDGAHWKPDPCAEETARLRDELAKARAEVARLRAGIGTLSDWNERLALRDEALARVLEAADERTATWLSMAREVRKHIEDEYGKEHPVEVEEAPPA